MARTFTGGIQTFKTEHFAEIDNFDTKDARYYLAEKLFDDRRWVDHIVHTHEETGRKSLYANPYHILRIQGLGDGESDMLIDELTGYTTATTAQYRHSWQVGDIVLWDNRCALHSATGGYPIDQPRIHWRVTIMQDGGAERRAA